MDYRNAYFALAAGLFLLDMYLRVRKEAAFSRGYESKLRDIVSKEEYEKSRDYSRAKNHFGFVKDPAMFLLNAVSLIVWPWLWSFAAGIALWGGHPAGGSLHVMCYVLVETVVNTLCELPFGLYFTFSIEEKFAFNNHTLASFASDKLKSILLNIVIQAIVSLGAVKIIDALGNSAWFYLWLFLSVVVVVLNSVYPVFIAPLFNKFTPLEEGKLKNEIEALIKTTGLNCKNVFLVDGSKQSKHSNAYVAGMCGTKRIVIYDTLIKDLDGDLEDIKSVVAHEIGHAVLHHQYLLLFSSLVQLFAMFFCFGWFQGQSNTVAEDFGFDFGDGAPPSYITLSAFLLVYSGVMSPILSLASNGLVRTLEFQADSFSKSLGYDNIGRALIKISSQNKSDLNPDWLHSLFRHNHPPLLERLEAIGYFGMSDVAKKKK
eukprot:g3977.t1